MQVTIKGEQQNLQVNTVTLQPENEGNMYAFFCTKCGNFLTQIGGEVTKLYPIYEPSSDAPVIQSCHTCKTKYTFQTFDGYPVDEIRVVLHPTGIGLNRFYCYRSKTVTPIVEYNAKSIIAIAENQAMKPPFHAKCPMQYCGAMYFFADLV